jgi:ribosomal protein S13
MAPKILQRLSIPYRISVGNLTEAQATALNGYLTSPAISDLPPSTRVVDPMGEIDLLPGEKEWEKIEGGAAIKAKEDWGRSILLETDLKKKVNDTIQTLYRIGTYRGYRCVSFLSDPMRAGLSRREERRT